VARLDRARPGAGIAFLLVGAGLHTAQTAGLGAGHGSCAEGVDRPKVVGLMYVSLLFGTMGSALAFGSCLAEFTPGRLAAGDPGLRRGHLVLNTVAMWKQEPRDATRSPRAAHTAADPDFRQAWVAYTGSAQARLRLVALALGTMGFAMQDVLLEPYGGEVLGMSVGATTWLTAAMALGGLLGFGLASRVLARGADPAGHVARGRRARRGGLPGPWCAPRWRHRCRSSPRP
jgi:BCD family chlorophyll transporter-like MFS transporter